MGENEGSRYHGIAGSGGGIRSIRDTGITGSDIIEWLRG